MKGYYIDLDTITLSDYEKELSQTELIKSRQVLKEDTKERFARLSKSGIKNLNDILAALKTPENFKNVSNKTGLPEEYLTILRREIASLQPKPVNLKDFPGIKKATIQKLEKMNIKNTKQLFDYVITGKDRKAFINKTGISENEILELTKLTDVCRIRWVGANFARLLVDSSADTLRKVSRADYKSLYNELMEINEKKKYFKGKFGEHDMKLSIDDSKRVPDVIEY